MDATPNLEHHSALCLADASLRWTEAGWLVVCCDPPPHPGLDKPPAGSVCIIGVVSESEGASVRADGEGGEEIRDAMLAKLNDLHAWLSREKYFSTKLATIQMRRRWWQRAGRTGSWPVWKWPELELSIVDFRCFNDRKFSPEELRRRGLAEAWIRAAAANGGFVLVEQKMGGFWIPSEPNAILPGAFLERVTQVWQLDDGPTRHEGLREVSKVAALLLGLIALVNLGSVLLLTIILYAAKHWLVTLAVLFGSYLVAVLLFATGLIKMRKRPHSM